VWLKPVLVCRVRFTEWTKDGHLRYPAFEGWRGDKLPGEVVREAPHSSTWRPTSALAPYFVGVRRSFGPAASFL
jgi:bifunctional non-homologous end joining protein LigD